MQSSGLKPNSEFVGNKLELWRYNFLTYVPRNLFEQFKRISNIWFLLISIFQLIPYSLNPTDSWTTIAPLAFLILISLATDAYSDYKLNKKLQKFNRCTYECWTGENYSPIRSEDILVGQFIKVEEDQVVPADMILVGTQGNQPVFLDMTGLIGVGTLKVKKPVEKLSKKASIVDGDFLGIYKIKGVVKVSEPHSNYLNFRGRIKLESNPSALNISTQNVLFSGGILKGAREVVGMVIYCGAESKKLLNTEPFRKKHSKMEDIINTWVLYLLIVLVLLVIGSVVGFYYFNGYTTSDYNILQPIITFILLYNNIIPISLFMVIDIIRILQNIVYMHYNKGISFNNHTINENFGQIDYLLMDKTGVLTERNLEVKLVVIKGSIFERLSDDSDQIEPSNRYDGTDRLLLPTSSELNVVSSNFSLLKSVLSQETQQAYVQSHEFVKCLALCNTLTQHNGQFLGPRYEISLVDAAIFLGYTVEKGKKKRIDLKFGEKITEYKELCSTEYSTEKGKSRVLLEEINMSRGVLYVHGTAESMIPLLNLTVISKQELGKSITELKSRGLKCVVFAYRILSHAEIKEYSMKVKRIKKSLINYEGRIEGMLRGIEQNLRYCGIAGLSETLLPGTKKALHRLQESGVKICLVSSDSQMNTYNSAVQAGILSPTSNLLELLNLRNENSCSTALLKGIRRHIYERHSELVIRKSTSYANRRSPLNELALDPSQSKVEVSDDNLVEESESIHDLNEAETFKPGSRTSLMFRKHTHIDADLEKELSKEFDPIDLNYSMLIDRESLKVALHDENCRKMLVCLLACARSICFAELMPRDKGNVVKLLKENIRYRPLVAAIGYREGDINMLQNADVGISIRSVKKSLTKNYSDATVNSIKDIDQLLLVQGHHNYTRLSKAILLFLYKNFFLTIVILSYTFLSSFSGQSIFNASLLVGYNIFFTSLPILVIGVLDEDFPGGEILEVPRIYTQGIDNYSFSLRKLLKYLAISVVHGIILIILCYSALPYVVSPDGQTENFTLLGTSTYITLVVAVLIQIYIETHCYSIIFYTSLLLSFIFLLLFVSITSNTQFPDSELIGIGGFLANSPSTLISIIFTSLACVIPTYAFVKYRRIFYAYIGSNRVHSLSIGNYYVTKLRPYCSRLEKLYRSSFTLYAQTEEEQFALNPYTLRFKISYVENKFTDNFIRDNIVLFRFTIAFLWVLVILWCIFGGTFLQEDLGYTLGRIILTVCCSVFLFMLWTNHFARHYIFYMCLAILITLISKFGLELGFNKTSLLATSLISAVTFLVLNVNWVYIVLLNVLNVVLFTISLAIQYSSSFSSGYAALAALSSVLLVLAIALTSGIVGYYCDLTHRTEHRLIIQARADTEKTQSILSMMLPQFVRKRVKEGVRYIAESQGDVSIVFCDISNFDSICKDYKPAELTSFLDKIFSNFDNLCQTTGVTKIETVGKTYMACAGLRDSDKEMPQHLRSILHSRRAVELAFAIIEEVSHIQLKNGDFLNVKIGVNSGPVSAGVVGYHKPQFSLVGDTVNTASRMCSTLDTTNRIQISSSTYEDLKDCSEYEFTSKIVEAKGKGAITVYLIQEKKNVDSDFAAGIGSNQPLEENGISVIVTEMHIEEFQASSQFRAETRTSKTWKADMMEKNDEMLVSYKPTIATVCCETAKEREFRLVSLEKNYYSIYLSLLIALVTYTLLLVLTILQYFLTDVYTSVSIIICRSVVVGFVGVLVLLHSSIYKSIVYHFLILGCLGAMHTIPMLNIGENNNLPADTICIEVIYIILLLCHCSQSSILVIFLLNTVIFTPWIALAVQSNNTVVYLTDALLAAAFLFINLKTLYSHEENDRTNHNLSLLAGKEIKENETLLVQLMPPHVLEHLEREQKFTDKLHKETLLFADIVGFTHWSSGKLPNEIVEMLSNLFTRFDKLCGEFDVYKVHTIGDCYVVMGDTGKLNRDYSLECINVMKMAYRMIDVIKEENRKHSSDLNMRIGVHTGEVIAGVIGTNLVRYDIWGPDVLIANKMESNGTQGRVKISEDTKELLEDRVKSGFTFEESEKVEAKSIGVTKKTFYANCPDINAIEYD